MHPLEIINEKKNTVPTSEPKLKISQNKQHYRFKKYSLKQL